LSAFRVTNPSGSETSRSGGRQIHPYAKARRSFSAHGVGPFFHGSNRSLPRQKNTLPDIRMTLEQSRSHHNHDLLQRDQNQYLVDH
jgi:hypothetical protein